MLKDAGWDSRGAPVLLQPRSLQYMRGKGSTLRMVQLIDGDGIGPWKR